MHEPLRGQPQKTLDANLGKNQTIYSPIHVGVSLQARLVGPLVSKDTITEKIQQSLETGQVLGDVCMNNTLSDSMNWKTAVRMS